jgi:hypothetical protein
MPVAGKRHQRLIVFKRAAPILCPFNLFEEIVSPRLILQDIVVQGRLAVPSEHLHPDCRPKTVIHQPVQDFQGSFDMIPIVVFFPQVDDVIRRQLFQPFRRGKHPTGLRIHHLPWLPSALSAGVRELPMIRCTADTQGDQPCEEAQPDSKPDS